MAEVVIYTKSYCPFSAQCREMLKSKNVAFDEKVIDQDKELEAEMLAKSGDRSDTPQVFVNSRHIGSFDDLKALDAMGKLDELLLN
ncbi:MAG: glutaredoxin 3 [Patescibacteria group bacterium]